MKNKLSEIQRLACLQDPELARSYAKKSCNKCCGRGIIITEVPPFYTILNAHNKPVSKGREQRKICLCVEKYIKKYNKENI